MKTNEPDLRKWKKLQSFTKIGRLALPAPLFNIGSKFAWLFLATTAWQIWKRLWNLQTWNNIEP